jgi:transcription elongation GreA/GreB family factor
MSRAFVREQDDVAPEPPPELMVSAHPNYVTARGLAQIEEQVGRLMRALADGPDEARAALLRRDLRYWTQRRASAQLRDGADIAEGVVGFGCRVRIAREGRPPEMVEIVGEDEADPAVGRLSWVSPVAAAMIGAEVGETVELDGRRPPVRIRILAVESGEAR